MNIEMIYKLNAINGKIEVKVPLFKHFKPYIEIWIDFFFKHLFENLKVLCELRVYLYFKV